MRSRRGWGWRGGVRALATCQLIRDKLGPEIGPRLHRTQPNSLDVIRSIGPDSALWAGSGATHNPSVEGSSPSRPTPLDPVCCHARWWQLETSLRGQTELRTKVGGEWVQLVARRARRNEVNRSSSFLIRGHRAAHTDLCHRVGQYRKDGVKARWPRIKKLERVPSDGQIELEPGETDEFGFDFFVRYLSTKMRHPSLEFSEQPPLSRAC